MSDLCMFEVEDALDIPLTTKGCLDTKNSELQEFIKRHKDVLGNSGVYIYAIPKKRARKVNGSQPLIPLYVGKTIRSFTEEAFAPAKIALVSNYLVNNTVPELKLFLVKYPTRKGTNSQKHVDDLETYLVKSAKQINPDLLNTQKAKLDKWGIRGVLREYDKRKTSKSAKAFIDLFSF